MSDDLYCLPLLEALPPLTCLPCVYNNAGLFIYWCLLFVLSHL